MNPLTNPIQPNAVRDAIHIAIAPVIANEGLKPGEHIGFAPGSTTHMERSDSPIGIVNPFGKRVVKGESFYLCLYPDTVTDMKHHWSHPAFGAPVYSKAEEYLRNFAAQYAMDLQDILDAAHDYVTRGEYLNHGPRFEGEYVPKEFWTHYSEFTGTEVSEDDRGSFFTCSC